MKIGPVAESTTAEILLVQDNEDDVFLTREAFDAASLRVSLHHEDNGEKCLRCSCYITQPVDFDNFVEAVGQMAGYWLTMVVMVVPEPP